MERGGGKAVASGAVSGLGKAAGCWDLDRLRGGGYMGLLIICCRRVYLVPSFLFHAYSFHAYSRVAQFFVIRKVLYLVDSHHRSDHHASHLPPLRLWMFVFGRIPGTLPYPALLAALRLLHFGSGDDGGLLGRREGVRKEERWTERKEGAI